MLDLRVDLAVAFFPVLRRELLVFFVGLRLPATVFAFDRFVVPPFVMLVFVALDLADAVSSLLADFAAFRLALDVLLPAAPPVCLFTVAQARRAASLGETPRSSYDSSM